MKKPKTKAPKVKGPAVTKPLPAGVRILERPAATQPPPRKGPPPRAPALQRTGPQPEFAAIVAGERANGPKVEHRPIIAGTTHLQFTSLPDKNGQVTTIVAPVKTFGDFSSLKGTIRYGRLMGENFRYAPGEAPEVAESSQEEQEQAAADCTAQPTRKGPPPRAGAVVATTPKAPGKPREGVCAWLDALIMESDGKRSVSEILALALAKFPGRDAASTTNTIRTRPSMMRAKGLNPKPYRKE